MLVRLRHNILFQSIGKFFISDEPDGRISELLCRMAVKCNAGL